MNLKTTKNEMDGMNRNGSGIFIRFGAKHRRYTTEQKRKELS